MSEEVTVSFHYLLKRQVDDQGQSHDGPMELTDFNRIYDLLLRIKEKTYCTDAQMKSKQRSGLLCPIKELDKVGDRSIYGMFTASSSGSEYENEIKGTIPSQSLNMRDFFFFLYFAENGRIYVSCQYLGLYGGYRQLQNTIAHAFKPKNSCVSHSIRVDFQETQNILVKEIKVDVRRKPKDAKYSARLSQVFTIVVKTDQSGSGFTDDAKKALASNNLFERNKAVRKFLSREIEQSGISEVKDEDILDCTLMIQQGSKGGLRPFHVISTRDFASKVPMSVAKDPASLKPIYEQMKKIAPVLLKEYVLKAVTNE